MWAYNLMANNEQLIFDLVLETKQAVSDIKGMLAKTNGEASKSGKSSGTTFGNNFASTLKAILASQVITSAFEGLKNLTQGFFQSAMTTESQAIAFKSLTKSQEGSAKLMKEINDLAVNSPYDVKELRDITKRFVALGVSQDEVTGKTKMMGDIASATGGDIFLMAKAYTDVKARGKLLSQEINQFANQGVPIREIIAKNLGVTVAEVIKLGEEGKISFDIFDKSLTEIYNKDYIGFMGDQAKTSSGKIQNTAEQISLMGQEILGIDTVTGKIKPDSIFDLFSRALSKALGFLTENKQTIIDVAKVITDNLIGGLIILKDEIIPKVVTTWDTLQVKFGELTTWYENNKGNLETFALILLGLGIGFGSVATAVAIYNGIIAIAAIITTGFGLAVAFVTSPLFLIGLAIGALVVLGLLLWKNWDFIKAKAIEVFSAIGKWIGDRMAEVGRYFEGVKNKAIEIKDSIVASFKAIQDGVGNALKGVANFVIDNINNAIKGINLVIKNIPELPGIGKIPTLPEIPKFAKGGSFMVGGQGGVDKNLVQFMATKREKVIIQTPAQQANDSSQTNSGNTVNQYYYGSGRTFSYPF